MKRYTLFIWITLFLTAACQKDVKENVGDIAFVKPANFPEPVYDFSANPVTPEGFELGRRLFYDPILSRDSSTSCGSCHIQYSAFSHPDHPVSHGIDGLFGKRNAPAIQNMAWYNSFFWDGGVPHLDLVPLNPISNPTEMDEDPALVLEKLRRHPEYPALFEAAFGTEEVNTTRFLYAMSQFMAMLVSADSRYDRYVRGEGETLTAEELAGLSIVREKCQSCHVTDVFTDNRFRNNGIYPHAYYVNGPDQGRFEASLLPEDMGKFKVPTLRNIAVTAPYMHDGSFATLESVVRHYATTVQDGPTLDPLLKQNGVLGIPLTPTEQAQVVAFLKTLTDETFLRDPRFSE